MSISSARQARKALLLLASGAQTFTYTGSGGAQSGGAATLSKTKDYPVSGGAVTGGAATLAKTKDYQVSGGAVTSGAATLAKTKDYPAAGGGQSGGAATTSYHAAPAAAIGGPALARLPRIIFVRRPSGVFAYSAQGGISAGAAAETSFEPVPPRVYAFRGQGASKAAARRPLRRRLGGQASVEYFDMGAHWS